VLRGEKDVTDAYKLGNYMRRRDATLQGVFPQSSHLTDAIQAVDKRIRT